MANQITKKQLATLDFLIDFHHDEGYYPSITEIAKHLGVTKKSAQERIIALEKKGFIIRPKENGRSIARAYIITEKWREVEVNG